MSDWRVWSLVFFFSSRRRHTRYWRDWSSDVCSSDLAGVVILLLVLGVDFPLMWGILTFFLSFIPWIGLPLAVAPAVVLALAEHGPERALLAIAGVIVINILAENLVSPMLMGRGLSLSPTFLFIGFIFWAFVLGGPGAFLAAPLTIFVVLMLGTFPETR